MTTKDQESSWGCVEGAANEKSARTSSRGYQSLVQPESSVLNYWSRQVLALPFCTAGSGERGCKRKEALLEDPDSLGVSVAPWTRESLSTGGRNSSTCVRNIAASAVWGEPRSSCTIIQVLSVSPKLLIVPGGLQGQLLWQTLTVPLVQLWEI